MSHDELTLNERIEKTNPDAPSVTRDVIDREIVGVYYGNAADAIGHDARHADRLKLVTLCFLSLRNGFTIVGKSACVSLDKYDANIGRELAYQDAFRQIWALEGYVLATRLLEG